MTGSVLRAFAEVAVCIGRTRKEAVAVSTMGGVFFLGTCGEMVDEQTRHLWKRPPSLKTLKKIMDVLPTILASPKSPRHTEPLLRIRTFSGWQDKSDRLVAKAGVASEGRTDVRCIPLYRGESLLVSDSVQQPREDREAWT